MDCTYADVPRELLEQRNKELLLEKASTYALLDKSVSVVSCKTVVGTVRDYLGRTGMGPVAGLESAMKQAVALMLLQEEDSDTNMDELVQTVEDIQRELTRADSLSYSARRDFNSMNNFDPSETARVLSADNNNIDTSSSSINHLVLCKMAIQTAVDKLQVLLALLPTIMTTTD